MRHLSPAWDEPVAVLAAFSVSDCPELGDEARSANSSSNKELSPRCEPRAQIQDAGGFGGK